jgi:hypothetical protein
MALIAAALNAAAGGRVGWGWTDRSDADILSGSGYLLVRIVPPVPIEPAVVTGAPAHKRFAFHEIDILDPALDELVVELPGLCGRPEC